jgi:exodeoxyribonuclease VII large subunit
MQQESTDLGQQRLNFDAVQAVAPTQAHYYTVSEITGYLQDLLSEDVLLGNTLLIRGELSNVSRSSRGHLYFTLKDSDASLKGVIWAGLAKTMAFEMKDGLEVYVTGKLEIYAPNGTYSLVSQKVEPLGVGALQLAFQQIKDKLEAQGFFLAEFKKPLPGFARQIGVITSRTGAVIHDMLRVIRHKNPQVDVMIAPVKVQGPGAAEEIAAAIQELNRPEYNLDLLIVARGGGSFEDLFCFSEEIVVKAIFESILPIITGIGHEPDFSLADATADYSASTPTAAAEKAVPDLNKMMTDLSLCQQNLFNIFMSLLIQTEQDFDFKTTDLLNRHQQMLDKVAMDLETHQERLISECRHYLNGFVQALDNVGSALDAFSPLTTLARGFSIATKASDGSVVSSIKQVIPGDLLKIRCLDGQIHCEVKENAKI